MKSNKLLIISILATSVTFLSLTDQPDQKAIQEPSKAAESPPKAIQEPAKTAESAPKTSQASPKDQKGLVKGNVLLSTKRETNPGVNYEHLKELEWLVGDWVDKDDNVDINFNTIWYKNKNFLVRRFMMNIPGEENLSGEQLITWDPIAKKIRSWVFDSDGGYGEGYWVRIGNNWLVKMSYTLSDGRISTGTQIYVKVDNDTYTFSSIGRDVDGEVLPNIEPVKIMRKTEKR